MVNAVSAIKRGLKGQEDKFSRNLEKSTREGTAKVVSTASEERSKLIREFTESIPENMRPFVGSFMSRNLEDLKTVKKFTEARDREKEREKEGRGKEDKNEDERKNTKEDRRNRDRKSTSNEDKNNSEKKKEYEKLCECSSEVSEQLLDKEVSMHI
ncbi:MAG: hypothetical protein LBI29_03905 [Rickettsiales bacterium]|nr:hypothetical protein [Rickettsiales bacterium]